MASIRKLDKTGNLFIDFRYQENAAANTRRFPIPLPIASASKKFLEKIESDIAVGTFDYRRYFPTSRNAAKFDQAPMAEAISTLGR